MLMRGICRFICLLCLACLPGLTVAQDNRMIYLEHSESLVFDKDQSPDYQVLVGDVQFRHDSAWMYCDTAHFYQKNNSLYAFGNVRIEQGDTLFIYGKSLFYDGDRKIAQMRDNVEMIDKGVATLYTDHLDYDRNLNLGYYFGGGRIVDSVNVLRSDYGHYNPATKMAFFKDNVRLDHPQFVLTTDTLNYHTETRVASIVSETLINSDESLVHAFRGWYNTQNRECLLLDRSFINSSPNYMIGDSVYYKEYEGIGEGFGHVEIVDSSKSVTLKSNYAYYDKEGGYSLLSDSALLLEYSGKDTLFLHADTLKTRRDSIFDTFMAYHNVRCYRVDLQGLCDSIFYSNRDSVLSMNGGPIIWSAEQMVRGRHMNLFIKNGQPDYLHVEKHALTVAQEKADTSFFNQSAGDDLKAYFENNKVRKIVITGSAGSIYLPHDEDDRMIGLNHLTDGDITLYMDTAGKMEKIMVAPHPKGTFYPLQLVKPSDKRLTGFSWPEELRPTDATDIFRNPQEENNIYNERDTRRTAEAAIQSRENRKRRR